MGEFLKKRQGGAAKSPAIDPLTACSLAKRFPAVWEFLTMRTWGDGEARETGTLLLVVDQGVLKAWVHDRDGKCSAWVSAASLTTLWERLEAGLRDEDLEWRPDRAPQGKGRGRSA